MNLNIYDICSEVYEKEGQSGVLEYVNAHPQDDILWVLCEACDSVSPCWNNMCLVCGSRKYKDQKYWNVLLHLNPGGKGSTYDKV